MQRLNLLAASSSDSGRDAVFAILFPLFLLLVSLEASSEMAFLFIFLSSLLLRERLIFRFGVDFESDELPFLLPLPRLPFPEPTGLVSEPLGLADGDGIGEPQATTFLELTGSVIFFI